MPRSDHGLLLFISTRRASESTPKLPAHWWNDEYHLIRSEAEEAGTNMGEIIQFTAKSELERARLIREARAIYDSIFPAALPISERQNAASTSRSDEFPLP
jgi:hypothetical protein